MAVFERSEYLRRIDLTKRRMRDAGIDVLLVTSPANMNYLTGYDGQSFYTHQMVALGLDDGEPLWIGRALDASGARLTVFMDERAICGYPDDYVGDPHRHPMAFVAGIMSERGWQARRLGVELDEYYFSARCYEELRRALPNARFVDASLLVNWVRMVKSPAELAYMRQAGKIATRVMHAAMNAIAPGVRQCDAMAKLYCAQISGTEDFGGDFVCKAPNVGTGVRAEAVHLSWEDKRHRAGETTWLETAGCRYRYHAPLTRTIHLGRPPERLMDAAKAIVEGLDAVLDAARPGVACEAVAAAWGRVAARHGIVKTTRIGYPVGVSYPPNWGELTASLRPGDRTVLEAGMTFHCIPGLWSRDLTVVISESFEVTEQGGRAFADFPRELLVKT